MLYVDGEPAASMRVRWFAGFAKLERAVILKRYRSYGLFIPFVQWAQEFCRKKGYPKAYLHAPAAAVADLRARRASVEVDDKIFHFSDHEYGAFVCDLEVDEKTHADGAHGSHGAEPARGPARHAGHSGRIDGSGSVQSACGMDRASRELRERLS